MLVGRRVVHELLEHPLEVGERVEIVAADLLDEGVDHRTAPPSVLGSDEESVLGANLGGPDLVLGLVVVVFDPAILEAWLKVRPLVHCSEVHIAVASVHRADYLVAWNCKHLANPRNWRRISDCVTSFGYRATVICTPEELIGDDS